MITKRVIISVVLVLLSVMLCTNVATSHQMARTAGISGQAQQITMADIDQALQKGPVFLEFETPECGYCKQQRPISEKLAEEYGSNVTFMFVDAKENRDLARTFQVTGVPQINVIANRTDGQYTYVGRDGTVSGNINESKFLGLTQEAALRTALDTAIKLRG